MKFLIRWPIPEVLACLMLGIIAGTVIHDPLTRILAAGGAGLTITTIGSYLRTRYDPTIRRWLTDSTPPDRLP